MVEVLVWLLLANNNGDLKVIERFPTSIQCEHVRRHLPNDGDYSNSSICVQARILIPKNKYE